MWCKGYGLDPVGEFTFEYSVSPGHWLQTPRQRWMEFALAPIRNKVYMRKAG
jgi:hypothetical protein